MGEGRDCVVARTGHMQDIFCQVVQEVRRRKRDRDLDEVFIDDAAEPKNGDAAPYKAQRRPTRRQLEECPYYMACNVAVISSGESAAAATTMAATAAEATRAATIIAGGVWWRWPKQQ